MASPNRFSDAGLARSGTELLQFRSESQLSGTGTRKLTLVDDFQSDLAKLNRMPFGALQITSQTEQKRIKKRT